MASITVRRRLRPLRFAFLVEPGNLRELRRAFQLSTILWGGKYNFIIPAYRRAPRALGSKQSGRAIVEGYLDAFEPDFVLTGKSDATKFGVRPERVRAMAALLGDGDLGDVGLSVRSWYQHSYDKTFAFELRHKASLLNIRGRKDVATFAACVFGEFPKGPHNTIEVDFGTLGGKRAALEESHLDPQEEIISPLTLGSAKIEARGFRLRTAMLLDPTDFGDLVDFWNLRALGWHLFPIPKDWGKRMAKRVAGFLDRNPHGLNTGLLKARSIDNATFAEFAGSIPSGSTRRTLQTWMPRPWAAAVRKADHVERMPLSVREDDVDTLVENERFSFRTLSPEFDTNTFGFGRAEWVNVISLRSFDVPSLAGAFPRGLPEIGSILSPLDSTDGTCVSSEGLTVFDEGRGRGRSWSIPTGLDIFKQWMKPRFTVELSAAGRITSRLIEVLGGLQRTRSATHPKMIGEFETISRSASKSILVPALRQHLQAIHEKNDRATTNVVSNWLDRGALGLGLRIACTACSQENWYALSELDDRLRCDRCLERYPFPRLKPNEAKWAYRPLGPFSVDKHALGAYSVAASIRLLEGFGTRAQTSWTPCIDLKEATGKSREVDFAMFWNGDGRERPPTLVLGECKTFDSFKSKDVARMRTLAQMFPTAVIVFAKLSDELTSDEKTSLKAFAQAGRKRWKTPVAVLLNRELSSDFRPPMCWQKGTTKEQEVAKKCIHRSNLRVLCDATQQLHLDMPPSEDWPHHEHY